MNFRRAVSIILILFLTFLSACSIVTPTPTQINQPEINASISTPTATSVVQNSDLLWQKITLIDKKTKLVSTNISGSYIGNEIPGSSIVLENDTKWSFNLSVKNLIEDVGEASTGIILSGENTKDIWPEIFCGYQNGNWQLGYAAESGNFTFWQTLEGLVDPDQEFQITLSADQKTLKITNSLGFEFQQTFSSPLFADVDHIQTSLQIGPQTALTVNLLTIDQKPPEDIVRMQIPQAISEIPGQLKYSIHVSPEGDDSNPGTEASPLETIDQARLMVQQISPKMTGPIEVVVHSGTYLLKTPLKFFEQDSGQNGYPITYKAAEGENPILSGGVSVKGWQKVPDTNLWKVKLPSDTTIFRQLYINGNRAQRASQPTTIKGVSYAKDRNGIIIASNILPDIRDSQNVELHWIYDWKDMRLKASSIEDNHDGTKTIWMLQPYYSQALGMGSEEHYWIPGFNIPFYVENAYELLDTPGEWYYDPATLELFYWPKENEDMTQVDAIIPQYQTLIEFHGGAVGHEVHDLRFQGLTFAYANWTRASLVGTFGWQAQALIDGDHLTMTPAHLEFSSARNISFSKNQFLHLGAAGIHLGNNTSKINIEGNLFYDIADAAIVIGHWDDAYLSTTSQIQPQEINITNNLIDSAGFEYWGAAGINGYYVSKVNISHNELQHLPYSGVSLGWGWLDTNDSTTCNNNTISNNLITDISQIARDAGGIYTLGQMPGTKIEGNVIERMKGDYACLYPDAGSAYITYNNNVCDSTPEWLHLWTSAIHDISIINTFATTSIKETHGTINSVETPHLFKTDQWPMEAQTILDHAGLESDFQFLHEWREKLN
jgi:hypothetical protein